MPSSTAALPVNVSNRGLTNPPTNFLQIGIGFLKFRLRRRRAKKVDEEFVDLIIVGKLIDDLDRVFRSHVKETTQSNINYWRRLNILSVVPAQAGIQGFCR